MTARILTRSAGVPPRRRWLWLAVVIPALAVPTWSACAQTAPQARRGVAGKVTATAPVKVRVWGEQSKFDLVLVGRTATHLLQAPDAGGVQGRVEIAPILGAEFALDYNRFEVMRAQHRGDWATAIRILFKAFEPTFAYLDIPNNNAAEGVMELGTTMLRSASRAQREAKDEAGRDRARKQYEAAYAVFQHCARVKWSSIGLLGTLKGCRCLLAMGNSRTAGYQIGEMEEPAVGDAAYGHYWLVQAELHMLTNGFAGAMDASVKSLCFENKDVETFPDALLISARCYEALGDSYRARDIYFEVAKLFPRTDWAAMAAEDLRAVMAGGATLKPEPGTVERTFLGIDEDMNALAETYLQELGKPPAGGESEEEQESEVIDRQASAGG